MTTIKEFINKHGITISTKAVFANPNMDGSSTMDNYKVTLKFNGRRLTCYFSKGVGHNGAEPTAEEVLDCLVSDLSCGESFSEFCSNFGYDEDSRKAFRTYSHIISQSFRVKKWLGLDITGELLNTERE